MKQHGMSIPALMGTRSRCLNRSKQHQNESSRRNQHQRSLSRPLRSNRLTSAKDLHGLLFPGPVRRTLSKLQVLARHRSLLSRNSCPTMPKTQHGKRLLLLSTLLEESKHMKGRALSIRSCLDFPFAWTLSGMAPSRVAKHIS